MSDAVSPADLKVEPLIRGTLELMKRHPLPLVAPLALLGLLTGGAGGGGRGPELRWDLQDPLILLPFFALFGLVALVIVILLFLANLVAWVMTTRSALKAMREGTEPDLGEAFRETTPMLTSTFGTGVIVFLAVVVGLLLLIVPGLIAIAALLPWAAVLVAEGKDGIDCVKRAWALTKGHKLDLFLVFLAGFVVSVIGGAILGILPIIGGALAGLLSGTVSAAWAVAGALFYQRRTHETPTPPIAAAPAVL